MQDLDLKKIESSAYRAAADTGLWDIFLASIVSMFAIAPLLSVHLGDFGSSAVFLPVYAVILVAMRIVQVRVIQPRIGNVEFTRPRRQRLHRLGVIMLVVNIAAFIAGLVTATRVPVTDGRVVSLTLSVLILAGFSAAALFLGIPRVFFYGVLLATAPPMGEALFVHGYASHHGFPVVFGVSAAVILVSGIVRFVNFLPPRRDADGLPVEEADQ
jgi:hypothetical protein